MLTRRGRDLEFESLALRLRDVEYEARRARARSQVQLQVLDVHVEGGQVHCAAAAPQAGLHPRLVVPRGFVLPGVPPPERDRVLGRADRLGPRGVDAAQTAAAFNLWLEAQHVARP